MEAITLIATGLAVCLITAACRELWKWLHRRREPPPPLPPPEPQPPLSPNELPIELLYLAPEHKKGTSIVRGFEPSDVILAFDPFTFYKAPEVIEKHRDFLIQKYKSNHPGKVMNNLQRYRSMSQI